MIAGGGLLVLNDAVNKWLIPAYPIGEIIFIRSLFVVLIIIVLACLLGGFNSLRTSSIKTQAVRGLFLVLMNFLFVAGLGMLPLTTAVAMTFTAPLFITLLATVMLAERMTLNIWASVFVGFLGVLIIFRPTSVDTFRWAALLPLGAALASALKDVLTRRMSSFDSSVATLWWGNLIVIIAGLCTAVFGWRWPSVGDLGLFALGGVALGLSHYLIIEAFRLTAAGFIAPFIYCEIIWSVLFDALIWRQFPDKWVLVGTAMLVLTGMYLARKRPT